MVLGEFDFRHTLLEHVSEACFVSVVHRLCRPTEHETHPGEDRSTSNAPCPHLCDFLLSQEPALSLPKGWKSTDFKEQNDPVRDLVLQL